MKGQFYRQGNNMELEDHYSGVNTEGILVGFEGAVGWG